MEKKYEYDIAINEENKNYMKFQSDKPLKGKELKERIAFEYENGNFGINKSDYYVVGVQENGKDIKHE